MPSSTRTLGRSASTTQNANGMWPCQLAIWVKRSGCSNAIGRTRPSGKASAPVLSSLKSESKRLVWVSAGFFMLHSEDLGKWSGAILVQIRSARKNPVCGIAELATLQKVDRIIWMAQPSQRTSTLEKGAANRNGRVVAMERVCFLHIGTHKTGSTSVQICLKANEQSWTETEFSSRKVGALGPATAHHNLAWELMEDRDSMLHSVRGKRSSRK